MIFADLFFMFAFLPLCFLFYFLFKNIKARNCVLIVFSLIFYACGEPIKIFLFVGSAVINYFLALWMDKSRGTKYCKMAMSISLIYNIGMLGLFKYTDFIIGNRYRKVHSRAECII